MYNKTELMLQLKEQIIEELKLEEVTPEDIGDETPLFVEGLQLDSIDALEIVVILDRNYGVKIKDEETGKAVFQSVSTIADYIIANSK